MAAKLTRLTHKIAIQLHLVADTCTICNFPSRRPVRLLLDKLFYIFYISVIYKVSMYLTTGSRPALGPTQPRIQWVPGALSLGVKRPEREADHSPPSSSEVKNAWNYTSTPQYAFMAWCLVKHRDNFIYVRARSCQSGHCAADMSTLYTGGSLDI
jgi:hypothetical protein